MGRVCLGGFPPLQDGCSLHSLVIQSLRAKMATWIPLPYHSLSITSKPPPKYNYELACLPHIYSNGRCHIPIYHGGGLLKDTHWPSGALFSSFWAVDQHLYPPRHMSWCASRNPSCPVTHTPALRPPPPPRVECTNTNRCTRAQHTHTRAHGNTDHKRADACRPRTSQGQPSAAVSLGEDHLLCGLQM